MWSKEMKLFVVLMFNQEHGYSRIGSSQEIIENLIQDLTESAEVEQIKTIL